MTSTYQGVLCGAITLRKPIVLEPGLGACSISSACDCVLRTLPHIFNNWYEEAIYCRLACCPLFDADKTEPGRGMQENPFFPVAEMVLAPKHCGL